MCYVFAKMQRDKYESILPEDENEEYYEYEINNINSKTINLKCKNYRNVKCKAIL